MVNQRLYEKLSYKPPTSDLVMAYLDEIAKVYQIDWNSTDSGMCAKYEKMKPLGTPSGASIVMAPGSGLRSAYTVAEPVCSCSYFFNRTDAHSYVVRLLLR